MIALISQPLPPPPPPHIRSRSPYPLSLSLSVSYQRWQPTTSLLVARYRPVPYLRSHPLASAGTCLWGGSFGLSLRHGAPTAPVIYLVPLTFTLRAHANARQTRADIVSLYPSLSLSLSSLYSVCAAKTTDFCLLHSAFGPRRDPPAIFSLCDLQILWQPRPDRQRQLTSLPNGTCSSQIVSAARRHRPCSALRLSRPRLASNLRPRGKPCHAVEVSTASSVAA